MRLTIAVLCYSLILVASSAQGDPSFPYKTTVASDDVYVRSGPGQNYYPTDKLKRGQEVEVYRHDPGGWYAIRPVEGSFTWVSGRFVRPTDRHLAVVTEDGVSARVGSRFSDIREVVQVRLQKGEKVEVLEEPPQGSGAGGWFKIAPPSGEFRWVSAKYLSTEYPRDGVAVAQGGPHPPRHDPHDDRMAGPPRDPNAPPMIPPEALHGSARNDESLRTRSARPRPLSDKEFYAELERIELELSVMVIEEPSVWSFDALRERTNFLLDQAQTAVERGRARLLADKIARFDDIKRRQDAVLAMRDRTDRTSRFLAKLRPRDDEEAGARFDVDDRFDGVGQLSQVVSPKNGAPRYALVDKAGDVQCYVTPAPGVNLHNYVGRKVGLTGARGYMPEQRSSHITARHVTPLEGSMLR